jgi:hypothetical protein
MTRALLTRLLALFASVAPACLFAASSDLLVPGAPAILTPGNGGTTTTSLPILVGWEFNVASPIQVDSLGLYTAISNALQLGPTSGQVGLWEDTHGALLASANVLDTDSVVNGFKYHALLSPVTLLPGQDYTVALLIPDSHAFQSVFDTQFASQINFVGKRFDYFPNGLSSPPVSEPMGGFGGSFTFTPVPEPSSWAISAAAGFCLWGLSILRRPAVA